MKKTTVSIELSDYSREMIEELLKRSCEDDVSVNKVIEEILRTAIEDRAPATIICHNSLVPELETKEGKKVKHIKVTPETKADTLLVLEYFLNKAKKGEKFKASDGSDRYFHGVQCDGWETSYTFTDEGDNYLYYDKTGKEILHEGPSILGKESN